MLCALVISTGAQADPRGHGRGHGWGNWWSPRPHWHHYEPSNPFGSIVGGMIGGWIGSQINRDDDDEDDDDEELEPWSREWYAYCARKFRSFSPEDGTYLSRDGDRRLCR